MKNKQDKSLPYIAYADAKCRLNAVVDEEYKKLQHEVSKMSVSEKKCCVKASEDSATSSKCSSSSSSSGCRKGCNNKKSFRKQAKIAIRDMNCSSSLGCSSSSSSSSCDACSRRSSSSSSSCCKSKSSKCKSGCGNKKQRYCKRCNKNCGGKCGK